jgi:hypothetical protein
MDMARPTRTPRAIATIVSTVVIRVVVPVLSPLSKAATPTRPRAPGTSSQNAGVKLTNKPGAIVVDYDPAKGGWGLPGPT